MDWNAVGKLVLPLAPTLGSILGGLIPIPGGSLIGQEAGQILANALGVEPTPTAVGNALANDPDVASKLVAAESEAAAKWAALAEITKATSQSDSAQSQAVNDTMRAELASGQSWWSWRNLYGYSVTMEVAAIAPIFLISVVFLPDVYMRFMNASSWLITWYTLRFGLLGFIHSGASNEKIAAVTGQVPGVIKGVITALKKK